MKKVPKLRFPEFEGEWEEKELGDLLDFKNGINASKEQYGKGIKFINVLDILNNNYIVYKNIIGKVDIDKETLEKNAVNYGDVLFQRSSETREEVGTANIYLDKQRKATFGGFIIRGRKNGEYNPIFINQLLKTNFARKAISIRAGGSTRYNVGQDVLTQVALLFPSMKEQDKIASLFSLINEKIEKQQQKVEALQEYKKGMIQKIFSKEIRFKDENGEEFTEWEENFVGNICTIKTGGKDTQNKEENGKYPFYVRSATIERINSYSFNGEAVLTVGDGVGTGKVYHYVNGKFDFHQRVYKMSDFKSVIGKYFYYYFSEHFYYRVRRMSAKNSVDSVRKEMIDKMPIKLPCITEQQKISDVLSIFDKKIDIEKQKLDHWKEVRKGLLQKMFV